MNKEIELAEWLLAHQEGLSYKIKELHNPAYHLFPNSLYDIYLDNYSNNVLSLIKKELEDKYTPEELNLHISKEFVIKVLGHKFLMPEAK